MSSLKDDTTEFIGKSDSHENPLTRSDEKTSTEKEDISRNSEADSKNHEKCIMIETAAKKDNERNGNASVDEIKVVISKPECQAGEPIVEEPELEIANPKKNVPDEIREQNDVEHVEERKNVASVAGQLQNDDKLNAAFIDEGNAPEYVESDEESFSDEDDIVSYNTTTQELTVGKIYENVLQEFEGLSLHKEKEAVSKSTQGLKDEDCEADSHITAIVSDKACIQDPDVIANVAVEEENQDLSACSKIPEVHNVATSTEDSTDVKSKIEDKGPSPSASVDEKNKESSTLSNVSKLQDAATSAEVTVDEGLSSNGKKLSVKQIPASSKEVAEIISKYLNSKKNMEKLDKIDDIVKQLRKQSSEEFLSSERSTGDLSPKDLKTLKEFYSQQLQKLATKRKSKICDLDEEQEDLQATSKKCKLSNYFDRPFDFENWETTTCCLEEQFRIAFNETNDGKEKEYKFPLSSGNEQPRKFCKHQIAKIDAMVASVMSLDNYMSELPDETDNPNNSTDEVYEDTPCCYHTKAEVSSARKAKDEVLSGPQESVPEEMIADSNECSEASDKAKWFSHFTFEGALKSMKNAFLFVSFTGSLIVIMAAGRLFGVDFPVDKSKRNITRDNSLQEFPNL